MKTLDHIAEMLHHRCGFAVTESSLAALQHAVDRRMEQTGIREIENYEPLLVRSAQELSELIEATIVSETFFFRYPESFAALRQWAQEQPSRPLRILSLACATGEEPYSIAMSLFDEGMQPADFYLEGTDISEQAIRSSVRGLYREKSFRSDHSDWRERYFVRSGAGWEARERLKSVVHFRKANLLELSDHAAWDVIFCRNVLIYFSGEQRERAIRLLDRALVDGGMLFLGPAEPAVFLEHDWKLAGFPMSFACVKGVGAGSPTRPALVRKALAKKLPSAKPSVALSAPLPAEPVVESPLERARLLANAGALEEAETLLADLLRREPENAEGHFLAGLVKEVRGNLTEAEAFYRKALFLDPSQVEALQHMKLLLRNQGRAGAAEHLARRLDRHTAISP